jgi:hypothetical protein
MPLHIKKYFLILKIKADTVNNNAFVMGTKSAI